MGEYIYKYPLTKVEQNDIIYKGSFLENKTVVEVLLHRVNCKIPQQQLQKFTDRILMIISQNKVKQQVKLIINKLKSYLVQWRNPNIQGQYDGLPVIIDAFLEGDHLVLVYPNYDEFSYTKDIQTTYKLYQAFTQQIETLQLDFEISKIFTDTKTKEIIILDYGLESSKHAEISILPEKYYIPSQSEVFLLGYLTIQFLFSQTQIQQFVQLIKLNSPELLSDFLQQICVKQGLPSSQIRLLLDMLEIDSSKRMNWINCGKELKALTKQDDKVRLSSLSHSNNQQSQLNTVLLHNPNSYHWKIKQSQTKIKPNIQNSSFANKSEWNIKPDETRTNFQAHRILVKESILKMSKQRENSFENSKQKLEESNDRNLSFYNYALIKVQQNLGLRRGKSEQSQQNIQSKDSNRPRSALKQFLSDSNQVSGLNSGQNTSHRSNKQQTINIIQQHMDKNKKESSLPKKSNHPSFQKLFEGETYIPKDIDISLPKEVHQVQPFLVKESYKSQFESKQQANQNPDLQQSQTYSILNPQFYKNPQQVKQNDQIIGNYKPKTNANIIMKKPHEQLYSTPQRQKPKTQEEEDQDILVQQLTDGGNRIKESTNQKQKEYVKTSSDQFDIQEIFTKSETKDQQPPHQETPFPTKDTKQETTNQSQQQSQNLQKLQQPPQNQQQHPQKQESTQPTQIIFVLYKTYVLRYNKYLTQMNIIGNTVAKCIDLLDAHNNVWIIPLFLIFKRMWQIRQSIFLDLQQKQNQWKLVEFTGFIECVDYKILVQRIKEEQEVVFKELNILMTSALAQLPKLNPDGLQRISHLISVDFNVDIRDVVFVYLYQQVLARIKQVIRHLKQGKDLKASPDIKKRKNGETPSIKEWFKLQMNIQATLIITEAPLYKDELSNFNQDIYIQMLKETNQEQIDQYISNNDEILNELKKRLKDDYQL